MFYSFVDLSINGHGSVASWRSSRADVFFWSPENSIKVYISHRCFSQDMLPFPVKIFAM